MEARLPKCRRGDCPSHINLATPMYPPNFLLSVVLPSLTILNSVCGNTRVRRTREYSQKPLEFTILAYIITLG
ncbi:uncharacterized protein BO66DRAFT_101222 [Aspergillus aculeatinus CBS 121060]|uniref:Uncharacterized protein n=1 Tax=Aspergillus aculeatinus CBS 121060 TaxID=1448322 RepID=A0ACD1H795_9EURO|nr:hypothetical protein BO66DRAFT_101222 [Aspergillus aculeatinus CBS 121060]RAH69426.1 hypothetical protein BO66DRAFT_101222 [Aspergillus aculeatinus CBS 121060]